MVHQDDENQCISAGLLLHMHSCQSAKCSSHEVVLNAVCNFCNEFSFYIGLSHFHSSSKTGTVRHQTLPVSLRDMPGRDVLILLFFGVSSPCIGYQLVQIRKGVTDVQWCGGSLWQSRLRLLRLRRGGGGGGGCLLRLLTIPGSHGGVVGGSAAQGQTCASVAAEAVLRRKYLPAFRTGIGGKVESRFTKMRGLVGSRASSVGRLKSTANALKNDFTKRGEGARFWQWLVLSTTLCGVLAVLNSVALEGLFFNSCSTLLTGYWATNWKKKHNLWVRSLEGAGGRRGISHRCRYWSRQQKRSQAVTWL